MGRRRLTIVAGAVALLVAANTAPAPAKAAAAALVTVSGAPYTTPTCAGDHHVGEVSVAVEPATGQRVAAWMQDVAGANDAGDQPLDTSDVVTASWTASTGWTAPAAAPGTMLCDAPPGPSDVAYDPSVAVAAGPNPTWYLATLGADGVPGPLGVPTDGRVFVHTSTDGVHWSPLVSTVPDPDDDDFPTIVADPVLPKTAYVVSISFPIPLTEVVDPSTPPDHSAAVISTTSDGGLTWSVPTPIHQSPSGRLVADARMVDVGGVLLAVYAEVPNEAFTTKTGDEELFATRLVPGATAWSTPVALGPGNLASVAPGGMCCVLSLAGSRSDTRAAVAWVRNAADGTGGDVFLASTADAGAGWAMSHLHRSTNVFDPAVAVNGRRTALTWYDFSGPHPTGQVTPTTPWLAQPSGSHWNVEPLTGAFDLDGDTLFGTVNLGDYQSLVPAGTGFQAVFTVGPPLATNRPTDIVSKVIP